MTRDSLPYRGPGTSRSHSERKEDSSGGSLAGVFLCLLSPLAFALAVYLILLLAEGL